MTITTIENLIKLLKQENPKMKVLTKVPVFGIDNSFTYEKPIIEYLELNGENVLIVR